MPPQKTLRTTFFLLLVSVSLTCEKSPTGPEFKNPRQYSWTADSINSTQLSMWLNAVWGSSPANVYAVGSSSSGGTTMLHCDGKKWTPVALPRYATQLQFVPELHDVFGFGDNNIFAVGRRDFVNPNPPPNFLDSSAVFHFDGAAWAIQNTPPGRALVTVWGSGPTNIWTAGTYGTLFHFDGQVWSKVAMDSRLGFGDLTGFASNDVYLLAGRYNDPDPAYNYALIFRYDGSMWQPIDSAGMGEYDPHFGEYRIGTIGSTLYSLGERIFAYRKGSWQPESDFTYGALQGIYAVNSRNAIVVGQNSQIFHYDGQSWLQLKNVISPDWWLRGVWSTENETFIVGPAQASTGSIILHGK